MPLSSALRFLSVWSGPMALAGSRPVDVCLQTIYGLNSGVFCPPSCKCLILTGALFGTLFRVCLHACYPAFCLFFCPPGYVHLYIESCRPITEVWTAFPRKDANRTRRRLESPCTCSYSLVQPGPVPQYRFYCLSARDTVCPIRCDVEILMAPGGKPSCLTTLPAVCHCQSQCEPTDSQTHLQSDGGLRCS